MSVKTFGKLICDGCGRDDAEIISTRAAQFSFGKIQFIETNEDALLREPDRKRRDYCENCIENDIYYCEECQTPHQHECPVEAAKMDDWYEANREQLAAVQYADAQLQF